MSTELPPSKEPVAEADSELVQVQQHPTGAVLLTLNRPAALNALDLATLTALQSAVAAVRSAPDVTAVVITGQGRLFSAGIDLTDDTFQVGEASDVYRGKRILDRQHELIEDVAALPMPTIAAVNGHAVGGGGFGLMMACDIRLAVADAQMWLVPAALSVIQDFGVTWALQRALGTTRTWTLLATGERLGATEALQAGLLSEVFADQAALREGVETWLGRCCASGRPVRCPTSCGWSRWRTH